MSRKKFLIAILIFSMLLLMLFFPKIAIDGSKNGLLLWFNTILPTLLPFAIISNFIIKTNLTTYISTILSPIFEKFLKLNKELAFPILIGFISGLPIGAKTCSNLFCNKKITKSEAQFTMCICNNASPMFMIGYIVITILKKPSLKLIFPIIIYISAILSTLICIYLYKKHLIFRKIHNNSHLILNANEVPLTDKTTLITIIDNCIFDAFETMTKIGGYIILFSIISQFVISCNIHSYTKILITGFLEITTAINFIGNLYLPFYIKLILISFITSFGGLCSIAQTQSVISNSGLSIIVYIKVKLLQAFISCSILLILLFIHII